MCREEDRLILSETHFNAQLAARWGNALRCIAQDSHQHLHALGNDDQQGTRRSLRLLAKCNLTLDHRDIKDLTAGENMTFDAEFDQPKVACICENAVLFYLTIRRGTFYIERYSVKASSSKVYQHHLLSSLLDPLSLRRLPAPVFRMCRQLS